MGSNLSRRIKPQRRNSTYMFFNVIRHGLGADETHTLYLLEMLMRDNCAKGQGTEKTHLSCIHAHEMPQHWMCCHETG